MFVYNVYICIRKYMEKLSINLPMLNQLTVTFACNSVPPNN